METSRKFPAMLLMGILLIACSKETPSGKGEMNSPGETTNQAASVQMPAPDPDPEIYKVLTDIFSRIDTDGPLKLIVKPYTGFTLEAIRDYVNKVKPADQLSSHFYQAPPDLFSQEDLKAMELQAEKNEGFIWEPGKAGCLASENDGMEYSVPLFNKDKTRCIFVWRGLKEGQAQYAETCVCVKKNGVWFEMHRFGQIEY